MSDALSWQPESISALRARVPAALEKVWDYSALKEGETPSEGPGRERTHVLDYAVTTPEMEIGIRTILSRERLACRFGGSGLYVHASCSAMALPIGTGLQLAPEVALQHIYSLLRRQMRIHHFFSSGPVVHAILEAAADELSAEVQRCRVCGCTESDCQQCIAKTGTPCHWVEKNLCSACAPGASHGG